MKKNEDIIFYVTKLKTFQTLGSGTVTAWIRYVFEDNMGDEWKGELTFNCVDTLGQILPSVNINTVINRASQFQDLLMPRILKVNKKTSGRNFDKNVGIQFNQEWYASSVISYGGVITSRPNTRVECKSMELRVEFSPEEMSLICFLIKQFKGD